MEIRINLLKKTYNAETKKFAKPVVDISPSWFILVKLLFPPKWRYHSIFCEIKKSNNYPFVMGMGSMVSQKKVRKT